MNRDPAFLAECQSLARTIGSFRTLDALRASREWPAIDARLGAVLGRVWCHRPAAPPPPPEQTDRIKAVHWNIEHGNRYEQIERALREHDELRDADVLMFNEIDLGMARSGNRDVAGDLARTLGLYAAWAPLFLEFTAGRHDDTASANGHPNQEALFGIGMLSRWPIASVRRVELPSPERYQFDHERMVGRHCGLVATIERPGSPFVAVAAHLEVHRTRARRATQVRTLLAEVAEERRPVLFGGDFNTHTFDRGRPWDPWFGAAVLMFASTRALEHRLLFPDHGATREPLFDLLKQAGFGWDKLVDRAPTLRLRFDRLDELSDLPAPVSAAIRGTTSWAERRARLRLDWFAARGFGGGRGHTVCGLDGLNGASDHAPIVCELW